MTETRASEREEAAYEIEWCRKCGAIQPKRVGTASGLTGGVWPADDGAHEPERFVPTTLLTEALEAIDNVVERVGRDLREPDKVLCATQSAQHSATRLRANLSDTKEAG